MTNTDNLTEYRVVVTGEMDRNEASPFYYLNHELDGRVWFKYPTRKESKGNKEVAGVVDAIGSGVAG